MLVHCDCGRRALPHMRGQEEEALTPQTGGDLETPLLGNSSTAAKGSHGGGSSETPAHPGASPFEDDNDASEAGAAAALSGGTRLNVVTSQLATTIIGAGIMALPRALATLGMVLGLGLLGGVLGLSLFSLAGLVAASEATRHWTYDSLVASQLGRGGARVLRGAILLNNSGSLVVYLIILGDILVGVAPDYSGLVTNLLGVHDPGVWWAARPFVVAAVCALFLAPAVSQRDLSMLAPMSSAAVVVAGAFAVSVVALGAIGVAQGKVSDFRWLPSLEMLGGSPSRAALAVISALPVITMSLVCHYQIHPLARSLDRFSNRRMNLVIRRSLVLCTSIFALVAASGYVLFGSATNANILTNLTPEGVATYVGAPAANVLCFGIRLGYCTCLMATFTMLNWALRETVATLATGSPALPGRAFYVVSYAILAAVYAVSILFPSVWVAMSLTGATAAVLLAYILPGLLIIKTQRDHPASVAAAALCIVLGVVMGCVGVLNTLVFSKQ